MSGDYEQARNVPWLPPSCRAVSLAVSSPASLDGRPCAPSHMPNPPSARGTALGEGRAASHSLSGRRRSVCGSLGTPLLDPKSPREVAGVVAGLGRQPEASKGQRSHHLHFPALTRTAPACGGDGTLCGCRMRKEIGGQQGQPCEWFYVPGNSRNARLEMEKETNKKKGKEVLFPFRHFSSGSEVSKYLPGFQGYLRNLNNSLFP